MTKIMSKKMLCLLALVALIVTASLSFAAGPTKTAREQTNVKLPPDFLCNVCVAYGGDIDPNSPNANGLASEKDVVVSDAEVVSAITVPAGRTYSVFRIVGNYLTLGCVIDPAQADWEIRTGVSNGNGGSVLASGTDKAIIDPTGRTAFGLTECHVEAKLPTTQVLTAGTYFFGLVPYCTGNKSACSAGQRYFLSDSPDQPPINGKGQVNSNDSFFNSSFFGATWQPTWGGAGACGGIGCNRMSIGLQGTQQ